MPIIQFLAGNPSLAALLALTIIGFTVSYGAALALGRIGVEVGFVLNVSPLVRRIFALIIGSIVGLVIGAGAGAAVGSKYGLGPDHVLLGLLSFLGLTVGTFLGGIRREGLTQLDPETDQLIRPKDSIVNERIRWLIWHYTSLELGQAITLAIAIVIGAAWGTGILIAYPVSRGGGMRILSPLMGAGMGAFLGGLGALLANPQGKILTVVVGMVIGLASAGALGILMITIGRNSGYFIPGLVYGGLGGACFGLLGGDPVHAKRVE